MTLRIPYFPNESHQFSEVISSARVSFPSALDMLVRRLSSSSSWVSDRFRTLQCSDMLHCHHTVISYPYRLTVNCTGKTSFARRNRIKSWTSWHLVSTCLAVAHLFVFFIRRLLHVTLTVSAALFDTGSCRLGNLNSLNIPCYVMKTSKCAWLVCVVVYVIWNCALCYEVALLELLTRRIVSFKDSYITP